MELAYRTTRKGVADGLTDEEVLYRVKTVGSFGGSMRGRLVRMLDGIELDKCLGIHTSAELFQDTAFGLVHFTSAVSAPTFKSGRNYTGYNPPLLKQDELRAYVLDYLGQELAELLPDALIIPLGRVAAEAVDLLVADRRINETRCVFGFPHPSGANGWRDRQFEKNQATMSAKVRDWFGPEARSGSPAPRGRTASLSVN
jgi:hypothetical protein